MTFLPRTKPGIWGLSLCLVFGLLLSVKIFVQIPLPSGAVFACGVLGLVLNVVALFRNERSFVFYVVGGALSSLVILWGAADLLMPH